MSTPQTSPDALESILQEVVGRGVPGWGLETHLRRSWEPVGGLYPTKGMILDLLTNPKVKLHPETRARLEGRLERWFGLRRPVRKKFVHYQTRRKYKRDRGIYARRDRNRRIKPRAVYTRLKRDARYRGIPWEITWEEWTEWTGKLPRVWEGGKLVPILSLRTCPNPKVRVVRLDTSNCYCISNIAVQYKEELYTVQ